MKKAILLVLLTVSLFSCSEKDMPEQEPKPSPEIVAKAEQFAADIQKSRWQLKAYYAENNVNLWDSVPTWLEDDKNLFMNNATVAIEQGAVRIPTDGSGLIERSYKIYPTVDGVKMDFLTHEYKPLSYYLVEHDETHFIIFTMWGSPKVKVYSRFETIL